jgi:DNA-binding transcriptional ArsR family regulator
METNQALNCLAALAQETRLAVFRLLVRRGEAGMAAGDIAANVGTPASTLSFHLKELERTGLVTVRRHQRQMLYAVDYGAMRRFMDFLQKDCCQDHPDICGCGPIGAPAEVD